MHRISGLPIMPHALFQFWPESSQLMEAFIFFFFCIDE